MFLSKKIIGIITITALVIIGGVYYYVFIYSKNNHRNVATEKSIALTAAQLAQAYSMNEDSANKQFLDKTISVTGEVITVQEDSLVNVTLKSNDAFINVYCTLQSNQPKPDSGKTITIKGICTGKLSDVVLTDAIIQNK